MIGTIRCVEVVDKKGLVRNGLPGKSGSGVFNCKREVRGAIKPGHLDRKPTGGQKDGLGFFCRTVQAIIIDEYLTDPAFAGNGSAFQQNALAHLQNGLVAQVHFNPQNIRALLHNKPVTD